jgi:hypothetical protein
MKAYSYTIEHKSSRLMTIQIIKNNLPGTLSEAWGQPHIVANGVILEQTVMAKNERLLRTYHPSLEGCKGVAINICLYGQ